MIRLPRPPTAFDAGERSLSPHGPESRSAASKARTAAGGSRPARRSGHLTLVSQSPNLEAPSTGGEGANHLRYFFDAVGNITEVQDRAETQEASRGLLFSGVDPVSGDGRYEYDALYRLTRAEGREHPGQQPTEAEPVRGSVPHANDLSALERYTEEFVYDEAGNIQEVVHTSTSTNWTCLYEYATTSNRLLKTYGPSDAPGTIPAIPYDAHGSMTRLAEMQTMSWDYADHLVSADLGGGGDVFFTYDASGERVRKVREHDGGGRFEERIYLGGFEIYRRWDGPLGDPATTLEVERETLHIMDDQRRIAMVETKNVDPGNLDVGRINAPRWRFQLGNHLDSAAMELDEASGILSYEEYHPYGSTAFHTAGSGAEVSAKRYRYTGKEKDEETGLYYHGARYYAAWLGRWTAADPAGLVDGLNLYRYSRDNSINFSDPGGTQTCDPSRSSCDVSTAPSSLEEEYQMSSPELRQVDQANLEQAAGMEALREGGVIPGEPFDPESWRKDVDAKLQGTATTEAKLARDQAVVKAKMAADEQATRAKLEKIESELPGTGESLVPVWGAAKSATVYFDNGEILAGTILGTMALSDLLGVKALLTSGGRLLLREGGEAVAEAGGRALAEGGEAAARGPIFADTNVLVSAAEKGNVRALEELRAGTTFVTPNQFREFLDVSTGAQRASRRAFLEAEGIRLFGGPEAGVVASQTDFQLVFRSTVDIVGRGDAALGAFARQTGYEAVTLERRLSNFFNLSRPKLEVPIRRLE